VLITFFLFGAVLLPPSLERLDGAILMYALLSLTLVRMVPVAVASIGARLDRATIAFFGWFGPRGLASILFALLVVHESGLREAERIVDVAYLTVLASIVLHGITALPFTVGLATRLERLRREAEDSGVAGQHEHEPCAELPLRWPRAAPTDLSAESGD
jgi:NhaP-type Na+/H+ or K+/H+ antiporter